MQGDAKFSGVYDVETHEKAQETYSVSANGRVTTSGSGNESQILYLSGQNSYTGLSCWLGVGHRSDR
jgi:hypothetical protein